MGNLWKVCVLSFLIFGSSSVQAAPSKFGRLSGVLRHPSISRSQLAKLDFIPSREEGNTLYLKAILTLHFGDFKTGEYVAVHFDDVRYDLVTQTFVFEQADQPVTLVAKKFTDTEFIAEFRSNYSGATGEVELRNDGKVEPKFPLFEPVWGEYKGVCKSKFDGELVSTSLQLYTYRSVGGSKRDGNPFRSYSISGLVGEKSEKTCGHVPNEECVWGKVSQGSFNFFKNKLILFTSRGNFSCSQTPTGISCDECPDLKRVSNETRGPRQMLPVQSEPAFGNTSPPPPSGPGSLGTLAGEYTGYLHHEFSDSYQRGKLNLLTYRSTGSAGAASNLRLSAIGSLVFGGETSTEILSYHFSERDFPYNPLLAPQFVFSQADADVDAILLVTQLGGGVVSGTWFSRLFGRVGTFVFRKDAAVTIPAMAKTAFALAGDFLGKDWKLYLSVGLGSSEPGNQNPFSPLDFGGWIDSTEGLTTKADAIGGSFDFYTGRLFLDFDKGKQFVGEMASKDTLKLKKLSYALQTPMPPFDLESYKLDPRPSKH